MRRLNDWDNTRPAVRNLFGLAVRLLAVACGLGVLLVSRANAAAPVEDFFKPADYAEMIMSPSGKLLAATVPSSSGRRALAVIDVDDPGKSKAIVSYSNADVVGVRWVNDDRLVYRIYDQKEPLANQRDGNGLFAIDAQGKEAPRLLIELNWEGSNWSTGTSIKRRSLTPDYALYDVLRDGSDDVLVAQYVFSNTREFSHLSLFRLNTRDGIARGLSDGAPERVDDWIVDLQGNPRMLTTSAGGKEALYWKATANGPWTQLDEAPWFSKSGGGVVRPIHFESEHRVYAVTRVAPHGDVSSLVVMDPSAASATGAKPKVEALLSAPGFDFRGGLVRNRAGQVLGIRYTTEAPATHWFDPALKKIQEQVDSQLATTNNVLDCGQCENVESVLVTSTADRLPAVYRLYRVAKGALEPIASSRPWIQPKEMAATDLVRIPARDGLSIPVYLTRPNGQKAPAPMVVLVHGGPWVRGVTWSWRNEVQFLASRGYVVVEPEFRGSRGYGFKLFRAGWKQWGLAMQDDLADAAQWAVNQGYADAKRICIAGASYGGYATLMGLIRNPELFRCGVEWVGVTDIDLMYSITWSDFDEDYKRYGMPVLVGDRESDRAQFDATSPIKLAARITQPLLMAYGGVDRRVPIDHGTQMYSAVRKTNPNVEWKVYGDEGHGFVLPANEIDFWTRVERFLDKNLKNAP